MMELKHWDTAGDRAGPRAGVVTRSSGETLHPSEQVKGYVEYCQRFHSAVQDHTATVAGCSFMTRKGRAGPYSEVPHDSLVRDYPLFTVAADDLQRRLPDFLTEHLTTPDPTWAEAFENGGYRQDRVFVRAIADAWLDPRNKEMVLLDAQRLGFERCLAAIDRALASDALRAVIIVKGPPGSGKSVLAAHLWAELARSESFIGNILFVTTSVASLTQWAKEHGADDVVRISLAESQFRCAGSKEYVDWVIPDKGTDYATFVQAPQGSRIHADPLCEVGCPYVVRGFDFDYLGVIWLPDLVWRADRWIPQIEHIHESARKKTLGAAKKEAKRSSGGPAHEHLRQRLVRGYRILLTRAVRGAYVWREDAETREHWRSVLGEPIQSGRR